MEESEEALSRITPTRDLGSFEKVDFVIEAITENEGVKKAMFEDLSKCTGEDVILATNTSSIPITRIAAWTNRADKVCGMHFMNPVPIMKLVEVIPGLLTSEETKGMVISLSEAMGKTTSLSKDEAGFIANRILMPYINEAIFALQVYV